MDRFQDADGWITPPISVSTTIKYGDRYWQRVYLNPARPPGPSPVVVFVAGSSWHSPMGSYPTFWAQHRLNQEGYAVASVGYNDLERGIEGALADIVDGIAVLRAQADERGIDANRIFLLGDEGGAHLAMLLATDESYFAKGGVPFESLKAVISVNGNGFDIPSRIQAAGSFRAKAYEKAFGKDVVRQAHLSPVNHLASPNAPRFLLLAAENESVVTGEGLEMTRKLAAAGLDAQFLSLPRFRHKAIGTYFLAEPGGAGSAIIDFLAIATAGGTSR